MTFPSRFPSASPGPLSGSVAGIPHAGTAFPWHPRHTIQGNPGAATYPTVYRPAPGLPIQQKPGAPFPQKFGAGISALQPTMPPAAVRPFFHAVQRTTPPAPAPATVAGARLPPPGVVQAVRGVVRRRWTEAQREQSRKFWERKDRKAAEADAYLTRTQRSELMQIKDEDEWYFRAFLKKRLPAATVYRGTGIGIGANSLNTLVLGDILPKPGIVDISFYGVVEHTHTNSIANGMVSTTTDLLGEDGSLHSALATHTYLPHNIPIRLLL